MTFLKVKLLLYDRKYTNEYMIKYTEPQIMISFSEKIKEFEEEFRSITELTNGTIKKRKRNETKLKILKNIYEKCEKLFFELNVFENENHLSEDEKDEIGTLRSYLSDFIYFLECDSINSLVNKINATKSKKNIKIQNSFLLIKKSFSPEKVKKFENILFQILKLKNNIEYFLSKNTQYKKEIRNILQEKILQIRSLICSMRNVKNKNL